MIKDEQRMAPTFGRLAGVEIDLDRSVRRIIKESASWQRGKRRQTAALNIVNLRFSIKICEGLALEV